MKKKVVKRKVKPLFELPMSSAARWLNCKPTSNLEYVPPLDPAQNLYDSVDREAAERKGDSYDKA